MAEPLVDLSQFEVEPQNNRRSAFWGRLEFAFGVAALLILSRAFVAFLVNEDAAATGEAPSSAFRLLLAVIYVLPIVWFVRNSRAAIIAIRSAPAVWLLVALAVVSCLWSIDPAYSLRRGLSLLLVTVFGGYLALRYSFRDQVRLLVVFALASFLLSIAFRVFLPDSSIDIDFRGGGWCGIYANKNALGRIASLGALAMSVAAAYAKGHRRRWLIGLALGVFLLFASRSLTGVVALFCTWLVVPICYVLLDSSKKLTAALIPFVIAVFAVGAWLVIGHLEPITLMMGRDSTFTGRTDLWSAAWTAIEQRPILGYGYNAFHLAPMNPLAVLGISWVWTPIHAHNGILNLWLDIGSAGVLTFIVSYIGAYTAAYRRAATKRREMEQAWPLVFMTYFLIYNVAESSIIVVAGTPCVFWVLYVSTVVSLHGGSPYRHVHRRDSAE